MLLFKDTFFLGIISFHFILYQTTIYNQLIFFLYFLLFIFYFLLHLSFSNEIKYKKKYGLNCFGLIFSRTKSYFLFFYGLN